MQINKPLVSILLAVYNPNKAWLVEQLQSLNNQTYSNIELYIYDDWSDNPLLEDFYSQYITNFSFTLIKGEKNLGSNKAFEELTKLGKGEYFSYCDQDDIWCANKIEVMVEALERTNAALVCSDVYVINSTGKLIANSLTKVYKRHTFYRGENVVQRLIYSNFVMGCAMLVKASIAQNALPFGRLIIHDHWIGICAALNGNIEILSSPSLYYRQHGSNQTGILAGVKDKRSYFTIRLFDQVARIKELHLMLANRKELQVFFEHYLSWLEAKESYFKKINLKDAKTMLRYKSFGKKQIYLELLLPLIPNFLFKCIVYLTKKGVL